MGSNADTSPLEAGPTLSCRSDGISQHTPDPTSVRLVLGSRERRARHAGGACCRSCCSASSSCWSCGTADRRRRVLLPCTTAVAFDRRVALVVK